MKYIRKSLLVMLSLVLISSISILAAEDDKEKEIPKRMQANTIIQYQLDGTYIILEGGELPEGVVNENGLTAEEQAIADNNYQVAIGLAGDESKINKVADRKPQVGLKVFYDGEGFIKDYKYLISLFYTALPRGTTSPEGTYVWGAHNNTLKVTSFSVTGTGRMTSFNDAIGENNNTLHKGDVATRGDMDNPKFGTVITVSANIKGSTNRHTEDMIKSDNGALPDAILDIWKTGVEYWGYTWSSSCSLEGTSIYMYSR